MRSILKYFVPIMIILGGVSVLSSDPNKPYSSTIPIVFGQQQTLVGSVLIIIGLLAGASVFSYTRKKS